MRERDRAGPELVRVLAELGLGLWAQVLAPQCFAGTTPGQAALGYLLERNAEVDNDVLLIDTAAS